MSKFKVGDEAILNKIENCYGDDQSLGHGLPKRVRIRQDETSGGIYDYGVETLEGEWIASVFEKNMEEVSKVIKREQIEVVENGMRLQYMTNTKKDRVSIIVNGNSAGRIKFERIDQLIAMLVTLKEEV